MTGTGANDNQIAGEMDRYLQAMTQQGRFSGTVLVAKRGIVVHAAGYGMANREHAVENTTRTKYRIGSITKQFTAMAILLLNEAGKLRLHDPISKHLPYSPDTWREITIHHLLNHTSGLARTSDTDASERLPLTLQERVEMITRAPIRFAAGTHHQYSNNGYILLGDIIERASGMTYEDFLREHIFDPLYMKDSGYDHHETILPNRATGYRRRGGTWCNADFMDMGCPFSAGALYSTVEDLRRWDHALRSKWLVSPVSHEIMTSVTPLLANYGYGLAVGREHNRRTISHAGGINGFRANFVRFPEEEACVVVLCNSEDADFFGVSRTLGAILFGGEYMIPAVKIPVSVMEVKLADYTGVYEVAPDIALTIENTDTCLIAASDNSRFTFLPESDDVFFAHESTDGLTCHRSDGGAVTHLTLRQGDVETTARRMPDRSDTRLIILEGMVGAGKSTTGRFLEGYLTNQGVPARFLPEWVMPHPIRLDDTLPHPQEPWRDLTVGEYMERSREKWTAFVKKRRFADTVTILDGQLFHGDLTNLLMMGGSREQLDRHVAQITEITAVLCPVVIYLTPSDVSETLDAACRTWGDDWKRRQIDWKTNSPYCQERDWSGYDGLVRLYEDYRSLTDRLFADLTMSKMALDTSGRDWVRYQEIITSFLPIATTRSRKSPTGERKYIFMS